MGAIVGIAGRAGSGKSTAARMLVRDWDFVELSFAANLKAFAGYLLAIPHDALYGPSAARNAPLPDVGAYGYWDGVWRRAWGDETWAMIQALLAGVGGGRDMERLALASLERELDSYQAIGDALTARHALQRMGASWGRALHPEIWVRATMREAVAHARPVCISDVRFANEASAIREAGGRVVWLNADARIGPRPPDAHASEPTRESLAAWITRDIDTTGNVAALAAQVAALAAEMAPVGSREEWPQ